MVGLGYTGNAHYSVEVFFSTCRGFCCKAGMNEGGNTKH